MRQFFWTAVLVCAAVMGPRGHGEVLSERAEAARTAVGDTERSQREALAHLYTIDQNIRVSLKRADVLKQRAHDFELEARTLGREVHALELLSAARGRQLNARLNSLYRRRAGADALRSLFAAESPAQLDRHQRYLRLMIDDDHHQMEAFTAGLREARARREKLSHAVRRLVTAQREVRAVESALASQRNAKETLVADLRARKESHLHELRALRVEGAQTALAFFERRGTLSHPVDAPVSRTFGPINDPSFKFKLMHKGWFYGQDPGAPVAAVAGGRVEVARELPGWGPTVMIDHGDHYHSVYACASRIKVREGDVVEAGQPLGFTGEHSPLFGPGLYFELRHFADAIDPIHWIKDPDSTSRRAQLGVNK